MRVHGFRCRGCGSRDTNTKDSRPIGGHAVRRRRQCNRCKMRFSTVEVSMETYRVIEKMESGKLRKFAEEMLAALPDDKDAA